MQGMIELLLKHCAENSFELRLNDIQPKILFKNGLTPNFLKILNEIVPIKLVVSTYKSSSYFRNGFNLIVFLNIGESIHYGKQNC